MYNANFYDPQLHQVIKGQKDSIDITILPTTNSSEDPQEQTEFAIGDSRMTADTDGDCLIHYLLEPLLEHHPLPVTVDGKPIRRLSFEPRTATSYHLMPKPLEGNYTDRYNDFRGDRGAGIIIDGVKYLPDHAQWTYNVLKRHSPHSHWTALTRISVYPLVDLGNPEHSDPSHPENIAEALSRTMSPDYQVPDWMRHDRRPAEDTLYDSWTPPMARTNNAPHWALRPVPIAVNGTPALIDIPDPALALTVAHALYNQPELGLVPVAHARPDHPHVTVTCPNTGDITVVSRDTGQVHRADVGLPDPDGPLASIAIPCHVTEGRDITVRPHLLFTKIPDQYGWSRTLVYATGNHLPIDTEEGDVEPLSIMAANAFLEGRHSLPPEQYHLKVIQAIEGTEAALRVLMYDQAGKMTQAAKQLSPHHNSVRVNSAQWTITSGSGTNDPD